MIFVRIVVKTSYNIQHNCCLQRQRDGKRRDTEMHSCVLSTVRPIHTHTHTAVLNKYSCAHLNIITVKPTSITSKRSQRTHGYNMCLWRRQRYSKRIDSRKATTTTMYMHVSKSQKTAIFSATTWSWWVCFVVKREKKTHDLPYTHFRHILHSNQLFKNQLSSSQKHTSPKYYAKNCFCFLLSFSFLSRFLYAKERERKNMAKSFRSNNLMLMYTNTYVDISFLYHSICIFALPIIIITYYFSSLELILKW